MRTRYVLMLLMVIGLVAPAQGGGNPVFTSDFMLDDCELFLPNGGGPFFSLEPGRVLRYEGTDDGAFVELEIKVLHQIKVITFEQDGIMKVAFCRVIREREWEDGELVEISRNWFARCPRTDDILYFGEAVDDYEDGEIVGHDGEWKAGQDGALPGIIMPGRFLLGSRYFQEFAPGIALDRAEHKAMDLTVNTPAGEFTGCVRIKETSELDGDDVSIKMYAPGVGLIFDDGIKLIEHIAP